MNPKRYLLVNTKTRALVDSDSCTAIYRVLDAKRRAGAENLEVFNTTHPKCPRWVRDLFVYEPSEAKATAGL